MDSLLSNWVESPTSEESSKESNFESFTPSRFHLSTPAGNLTLRRIESGLPGISSGRNEFRTERSVALVDESTRGLRLSTIATETQKEIEKP